MYRVEKVLKDSEDNCFNVNDYVIIETKEKAIELRR